MTALSLAAGCSGGDDNPVVEAPTSTSMPTAITGSRSPAPTSPTTAEATVDPTVVPDEITVEYLDAVMAEHDRLVAQVYRHLAASGDPTDPTVLERYAAFANVADAKRDVEGAIRGFGVDGIADDPQPLHAEVEQIIDQRDGCVLFTLSYDSTPLLADDVDYEPAETYYAPCDLRRSRTSIPSRGSRARSPRSTGTARPLRATAPTWKGPDDCGLISSRPEIRNPHPRTSGCVTAGGLGMLDW